ncbi:MAG: ATP-dependent Clp protease ATP-binding subunit [Cyanobacteria bacterium P01_F01_bin.143]
MFERFNDKAIKVILLAQEESRRLKHNFVAPEQMLIGLILEGTSWAAIILQEFGLTLPAVSAEVEKTLGLGTGFIGEDIPFNPKARQVLERANKEAQQLAQNYVSPEHLLLALIREPSVAKILQNLELNRDLVRTQIIRVIRKPVAVGTKNTADRKTQSSKIKALAEFGTNLTQLAIDDKIDPVVGREQEIERVIQILGRRTKNNPVLIGEPGVGKTAIAEGLAQRIISQDVPELLRDKQVISLDIGQLIAGTSFRGEFEERLKQVMAEVRQAGNIILVIDEVHTLVGAGSAEGGMDAANLLKPALARGELQCIGATTLGEYREHIEKDAALERRFQPVIVKEPSVEDTVEILRGIRSRYEEHHRLVISDQAVTAAAQLSDRYISDRYLPDKAIDLIDEAGSRVHLRHSQQALENPIVKAEDIAQVVSAWTGVPVNRLSESESLQLLNLEETLHQRVIGQKQAVTAVARAIRRSRVGLRSANRPIASVIFCGPTGVGKTELTKALAASIFGSEEAMIRLDMSEYMESQSVSKLIGSPPGYVGYGEGGQLTEAVRRQPYAVVLFDEIEKAHPDVFNLMLQLLEDGRLTDAQGRVVNFTNTLIIMTSNLGARAIEKQGTGLGFFTADLDLAEAQYNRTREQVNEALKQSFRPEFLNRLDEIIVFQQLTRNEVKQIAELLLANVEERLKEQDLQLEVSEAFKDLLVTEGYDPSYGARPLRRAVSRLVEDNLAEAILLGQIQVGDTAVIDIDDDGRVQVQPKQVPVLVAG